MRDSRVVDGWIAQARPSWSVIYTGTAVHFSDHAWHAIEAQTRGKVTDDPMSSSIDYSRLNTFTKMLSHIAPYARILAALEIVQDE